MTRHSRSNQNIPNNHQPSPIQLPLEKERRRRGLLSYTVHFISFHSGFHWPWMHLVSLAAQSNNQSRQSKYRNRNSQFTSSTLITSDDLKEPTKVKGIGKSRQGHKVFCLSFSPDLIQNRFNDRTIDVLSVCVTTTRVSSR